MYRNTATLSSGHVVPTVQLHGPPPATDDGNSIKEMLQRKRQQLDLEIEEFMAMKEREFQEFERSLRKQKRGRRRDSGSKAGQSDARPGALSLLNLPVKQQQANGVPHETKDKDAIPRGTAPLSRPTTGVDKMSINAELPPTPMKSKFASTKAPKSPQPSSLSPVRRGTKHNKNTSTARPPPSPLSPGEADTFAGVFTPAYLPLLDSRPSTASVSPKSSPPARHGSFSLPDSESYKIAPMRRSSRSQTEPVIPSTSLPSALRTASGTIRKRKHVTFQLADSAIVEPSSSYEEMPSPSPKDESNMDGAMEELMSSDEDVPPPNNGLAFAVPSPDLRGRDRSKTSIPGDLTVAIEGGGAGGFFELDEELSSPGLDAGKPFMDDFDDDTSSPVETRRGDDEDEDEKGIRWGSAPERQRQTFEYGGSVPIDIVRPSSSWVGSFGH